MVAYIAGDVEDASGQRMEGCWVAAIDHQGGTYYHGLTNSMGHYEIQVSNNNHYYNMEVWHSGYAVEYQNDIGAQQDTTTWVDWKPPDHNLRASVVGVVQDDEGLPIPGAIVWGEGSSYRFGSPTNGNGEYSLPLHKADTYTIKAVKNNFVVRSNGSITQSSPHPTAPTTKNFTGSYYLARILGTIDLGYAVHGRSVVIPDYLSNVGLTHADNPATTTVFVKTRVWGTGSSLSTNTHGSAGNNADEGDGSGGSNYDGDCGDCGYPE